MKKITILALTIFLGLLLIAGGKAFTSPKNTADNAMQVSDSSDKKAMTTVVLSEDDIRRVEVEVSGQVTALMGLKALAEKEGLELETKDYDFGTLVQAIESMESGPDYAWIFFVNGESSSVGASEYVLKPKDVIEWKYLSVSGGDGNE